MIRGVVQPPRDADSEHPNPDNVTTAVDHDLPDLGLRLRDVRTQLGLTLAEVEHRSEGLWKATAVGAYERGERTLTLPRLMGLARFYGVPPAHLLPQGPPEAEASPARDRVVLDLEALPMLPVPEGSIMHRYVTMLQAVRADWTSSHLAVRRDDLAVLAAAYGTSVAVLLDRLRDWGLILPPAGPSTTPHGMRT